MKKSSSEYWSSGQDWPNGSWNWDFMNSPGIMDQNEQIAPISKRYSLLEILPTLNLELEEEM